MLYHFPYKGLTQGDGEKKEPEPEILPGSLFTGPF